MQMYPDINYLTFAPPPILAPFVRFFWVMEGKNITSGTPYVYRSMADGGVEMLFHYQGIWDELRDNQNAKSFTSGIHGPARQYRRFSIHQDFGLFGVYLYPFALPCLFSIPAEVLSNEMPDLQMLFSKEGKVLEEKIMLSTSHEERIRILSLFFIDRLKNMGNDDPAICSVIRQVIQRDGRVNVLQMATDHHLSMRQFQRKFKLYSGFSPKLYARIIRFDYAMQHFGHSGKSLTEIAYDCGYYDQSHFIHDFKMFSGYAPKDYFKGDAEGTEWRAG